MKDIQEHLVQSGYLFPSSDIYGGLAGAYDYGPLGAQLKKTIVDLWWRDFVERRPDCVGVDTPVLLNPRVWEASGHVDNFSDPLTQCKQCQSRERVDKLLEAHGVEGVEAMDGPALQAALVARGIRCGACGTQDAFSEVKNFNLLFTTQVGAAVAGAGAGSDASTAYLRPETAQGVYIALKRIATAAGIGVPFGVGQVGKAFRNEISPAQSLFRTREFEQMEMQFFAPPCDADEWQRQWTDECYSWLIDTLGLHPDRLRRREHAPEELAHYARSTTDIEFSYPFGWGELWGIANRGDHDLRIHANATKAHLKLPMPGGAAEALPFVIEPSVGLGRLVLAVLTNAIRRETPGTGPHRIVMDLPPQLAPVQVAVMPLMPKPGLAQLTDDVFRKATRVARAVLSTKRSIGKRYYRQDERGTPFCLTVDFDSQEDGCVTLRHRGSGQQERLPIDDALAVVRSAVAL